MIDPREEDDAEDDDEEDDDDSELCIDWPYVPIYEYEGEDEYWGD